MTSPKVDRAGLFNEIAEGVTYPHNDKWYSHLLDQYKLYVEMADRVSARRGLTNTFFLTLNTTLVGLAAVIEKTAVQGRAWWLAIPLAALLGECFTWFYLVRGYRLLNTAKYQVVGVLEERLPASPFVRGEWWCLAERRGRERYWPLSFIEQWVPALFALIYVAGYLVLVLR